MKIYFKILCVFFLANLLNASDLEVRYLQPPRLDASAIGKRIVCYRPTREQTPNFSIEQQGGKTLIHNYGHGGAGWSLGMGSVQYCCGLLEKNMPNLEKSTPIAIVGGGCIGLFTAYHLWNMGFENITIYAKSFEDLTSHHAGGLLSFRADYSEQTTNDLILMMGENTYHFFRSIAQGEHSDFPRGASVMPTYCDNLAPSDLENLVDRGMQPAKEVLLEFGNGVQRKMTAYDDSLFIDTGAMMEQLNNYLRPKIAFKQQVIVNFNNLKENVIFNCCRAGSSRTQSQ